MHKDSIRTDSSPTHLSEEPDFAGAGVAGGLEGGHEWFVGMDFVGEAFARTLLAVVWEIGHSEVLLELVHNTEIFD